MNLRACERLNRLRRCVFDPISRMRRDLLNRVFETERMGMSTNGSREASPERATCWPSPTSFFTVFLSRAAETALGVVLRFFFVVVDADFLRVVLFPVGAAALRAVFLDAVFLDAVFLRAAICSRSCAVLSAASLLLRS